MDYQNHPKIQLAIIGLGRVGMALYKALTQADCAQVIQVYNRTDRSNEIAQINPDTTYIHKLSELANNLDLIIIAVKDDALQAVAEQLPINGALVVHISGTVSSTVLKKFQNFGVWYPLQTFSADESISLHNVPFCVYANTDASQQLLQKLTTELGGKYYAINDEARGHLHLAAVYVNNFTNHLLAIANEYTDAHHIDFEILKPLIEKTYLRATNQDPKSLQTGPAIRTDIHTMNKHLQLLRTHPQWQKIYTEISRSIMEMYSTKI